MHVTEVLLAIALHYAPAELALRPQPTPLRETVAERLTRTASIVDDAWAVAAVEPPLPGFSREQTAAALLAVAFVESGFRLDVDRGKCASHDCDNGRALCVAQIQPLTTEERADVLSGRQGCFRAERRRIDSSIRTCRGAGAALALYTGPACDDPRALDGSRVRLAAIRGWRDRLRDQLR